MPPDPPTFQGFLLFVSGTPDTVMFCMLFTLCCPNGTICHEKCGALSPKESQLQQSRATQPLTNYKVHAGSFCGK